MTRSLTILGATGSVGSQTLDLVARNPGRWQVEALTAGSDVAGLVSAAKACGARFVAIADSAKGAALDASSFMSLARLARSGISVRMRAAAAGCRAMVWPAKAGSSSGRRGTRARTSVANWAGSAD